MGPGEKNFSLLTSVNFFFSQVLQTFEVTGQGLLKDISYGKEDVPVSCVNSVDNSSPEYIEYSTKRLPQEGVSLNLTCATSTHCDGLGTSCS